MNWCTYIVPLFSVPPPMLPGWSRCCLFTLHISWRSVALIYACTTLGNLWKLKGYIKPKPFFLKYYKTSKLIKSYANGVKTFITNVALHLMVLFIYRVLAVYCYNWYILKYYCCSAPRLLNTFLRFSSPRSWMPSVPCTRWWTPEWTCWVDCHAWRARWMWCSHR